MEPRNVAENDASKPGENSFAEDRIRCSSVSSVSSAKSASSDFSSFEDPYQLDANDHGSFALDSNNVAPSTALETPPTQVMERTPDESGYRIPSHVFASKSSTPNADWSTASNESLFSIHTGNMSFTRDQFNWMQKSGELGIYGAPGDIPKSGELGIYGAPGDVRKSGELPPPSPRILPKSGEQKPFDLQKPSDTQKSGEQIIANHFKASSTSPVVNKPAQVEVSSPNKVNDAAAAATDAAPELSVSTQKNEPKDEVKAQKKGRTVSDEVPPTTGASPHHSDASGQSFAFPVLAEIGRDKSVNSGQSRAEAKNPTATEQDGQKSPTSGASPAPASSSWLSRLSRCSCC